MPTALATCATCGHLLDTGAGFPVYEADESVLLCPACYQQRMMADTGGPTGDLAAEVAQDLGAVPGGGFEHTTVTTR